MTTPETNGPGEPTRELSVSTAPPPAPRRWWTAVPHHLGRARTSTVVLALLFVGLYVLYLYVRPPDPPAGPTSGSTVQTPVTSAPATTGPAEPTQTPGPTTSAPTTTPTTTAEPTTAPLPTEESGRAGESPGQTSTTTVQPTAPEAPATPPRTTAAAPTP